MVRMKRFVLDISENMIHLLFLQETGRVKREPREMSTDPLKTIKKALRKSDQDAMNINHIRIMRTSSSKRKRFEESPHCELHVSLSSAFLINRGIRFDFLNKHIAPSAASEFRYGFLLSAYFFVSLLTVINPWIRSAAKRARLKYATQRSMAAAGRALGDSKIQSSSKANAIR